MDSEMFNTLYHLLRRTWQCLEIKAMQLGINTEETSIVIDLNDDYITMFNMAERINFIKQNYEKHW
jgi:hypothetical protein